jgi:hypothetical protein
MFEHRSAPLLNRTQFYWRLARAFGVASLIVAASLLLGTTGYHFLGELSWLDALLNSAMILTGMGPVNPIITVTGKLFATFYALYSGIAFLSLMAVLLAPIIHRAMHKFHLDLEEDD